MLLIFCDRINFKFNQLKLKPSMFDGVICANEALAQQNRNLLDNWRYKQADNNIKIFVDNFPEKRPKQWKKTDSKYPLNS